MTEVMTRAMAALDAFMNAWKTEDWGAMLLVSQKTWTSERGNALKALKARFSTMRPESWTVEDAIEPKGLAKGVAVDATVAVHFLNMRDTTYTVRLICEIEPYKADPEGAWGVNPPSWKVTPI